MKKIFLLTTLSIVALLSGCKKDDPDPQELLIGNWQVTKLVVDGEDVLAPNPDLLTEVVVEFTESGSVIFEVSETDLTTNPVSTDEYTFSGSYSWEDDRINVSIDADGDILAIGGNIDVTRTRLVINATSGDTQDFFSLLEATKL